VSLVTVTLVVHHIHIHTHTHIDDASQIAAQANGNGGSDNDEVNEQKEEENEIEFASAQAEMFVNRVRPWRLLDRNNDADDDNEPAANANANVNDDDDANAPQTVVDFGVFEARAPLGYNDQNKFYDCLGFVQGPPDLEHQSNSNKRINAACFTNSTFDQDNAAGNYSPPIRQRANDNNNYSSNINNQNMHSHNVTTSSLAALL
jgi:hypothetical protein